MIGTVVKSELKGMLRDKMTAFFIFFPIILGAIGYFIIPVIEDSVQPGNPTPQIVAMFLILMTGYIFGAVTGFTLMDDRDDNVLMSLKITPISVRFYVVLKLLISYFFGVLATIILIYATGFLPDASVWTVLMISIIGALQGPAVALIVNSLAKNKVEGFVIMKMSGLLLIVPVLTFFVITWKEVFLIFAPGFWPGRMIQMELLPSLNVDLTLTFTMYFFIGIAYNLLFSFLMMKLYTKKANI